MDRFFYPRSESQDPVRYRSWIKQYSAWHPNSEASPVLSYSRSLICRCKRTSWPVKSVYEGRP